MADETKAFAEDEIIKPYTDSRSYLHTKLENGMKVLLISDPESEKAAACMRVEIGSLKDPDDLPGLAHFCEHMLFLGTKKYPKENDYFEFVTQHGGASNACTTADATMFFFEVAPADILGALDRFLQFFLHPLFNESATEREVLAVDSENSKNFQADPRRIHQVMKCTSRQGHPFARFSAGSKASLMDQPAVKGINVREELIKFHSQFYSSNLMSLCVLGQESTEDLAAVVRTMFSPVVNKVVPRPICSESQYLQDQLQVCIEIVPVKQLMQLTMAFPIPDYQEHYKTKPTHYIAHLIGHEGPGSVLSVLKAKGWATGLCAGSSRLGRGFWEFIATMDLTEEGEDHTNEIVELVFQYFALLRKEDTKEWIFRECADMNEVEFRFAEQQSPMSSVVQLAGVLQDYPPKDCIYGNFVMTDFNCEVIDGLLELLTPQNFRLILVSQRYRGKTTNIEPWYLVDYNMKKIDPELISKWTEIQLSPDLFLPAKNEFLPTNFVLVPPSENPVDVPVIVKETPVSTLFYRPDDKFKVPKVYYRLEFASPLAYDCPENCGLLDLYVKLLQDSLNEYAYAAEISGIDYKLYTSMHGMELVLSGYSDKLNVLLTKIVGRLTTFEIDSMKFKMYLDMRLRTLRNFEADQPYSHAMYYVDVLMTDHVWSRAELIHSSTELTPDDLRTFIPKFFRRVHITMLAYGNTTVQDACATVASIEGALEEAFASRALAPGLPRRKRQLQLNPQSKFLFRTDNLVHASSCTAVYYQVGIEDTSTNLLLEMLNQIIGEPFFAQLRTKEQLGYIVFTSPKKADGVQGLMVLVQSPKHPGHVEERMEAFLKTVEETITGLSETEFECHRTSLIVQKTVKPKTLKKQGHKYWMEISAKSYHFKRDEVEVEFLQTITKHDVVAFYKERISSQGSSRKKLSVHVLSKDAKSEGFESTDSQSANDGDQAPMWIEDVQSFKDAHGLYPLARPCVQPVKSFYSDK